MKNQYLIAGLGNIGKNYDLTRHNVGFMLIDVLCAKYNIKLQNKDKFQALISAIQPPNQNILLACPTTYMNLSGSSIQKIKAYYKIDIQNIIIIHDDLDFPLGKIKVKQGGGHAGHNGLKSIDSAIGKNYIRVRIGIDKPNFDMDVSDYVLSRFNKNELAIINESLYKIIENIHFLLENKLNEFMQSV